MNSFIKSLMEERSLKQKDLAAILGITSSAVSSWDEEVKSIRIDHLFSLSKLFNVAIDELLEGKRTYETLEDKWKREYGINETAAKTALINGEKEKVLKYFAALLRADKTFFELFEKKVIGNISDNELKEWEYLKQFYDVNIRRSNLFNDFWVGTHDSEMILNTLIEKIGANNIHAVIWELQKIYHITNYGIGITADREIIPIDDYYDIYGDDPLEYLKEDEDIFFAVYSVLSPIEKDEFLTSEFQNKRSAEYLYKLISRGGHILYTSKDLLITNYDHKDLDELEGVKPVPELDEAQVVLNIIYNNYSVATCEQYQTLTNRPRMRQIEIEAKYKTKNPVKYWEYIKGNEVLI